MPRNWPHTNLAVCLAAISLLTSLPSFSVTSLSLLHVMPSAHPAHHRLELEGYPNIENLRSKIGCLWIMDVTDHSLRAEMKGWSLRFSSLSWSWKEHEEQLCTSKNQITRWWGLQGNRVMIDVPVRYLCNVSALSIRVQLLLARMRTSGNGSAKSLAVLSPKAGPFLHLYNPCNILNLFISKQCSGT